MGLVWMEVQGRGAAREEKRLPCGPRKKKEGCLITILDINARTLNLRPVYFVFRVVNFRTTLTQISHLFVGCTGRSKVGTYTIYIGINCVALQQVS